ARPKRPARPRTAAERPRPARDRALSERCQTRPALGAGQSGASLAGEEPPDRLGRTCQQLARELGRRLAVAAIEHHSILHHLATVLAEQSRPPPHSAVPQYAAG